MNATGFIPQPPLTHRDKVKILKETNAHNKGSYDAACKKSRLPSGWRWRKLGEYPMRRDVLCDPRVPFQKQVETATQIVNGDWPLGETHHPVRTRKISPVSFTAWAVLGPDGIIAVKLSRAEAALSIGGIMLGAPLKCWRVRKIRCTCVTPAKPTEGRK